MLRFLSHQLEMSCRVALLYENYYDYNRAKFCRLTQVGEES